MEKIKERAERIARENSIMLLSKEKEILEKLTPNYALISVGENRFGHPIAYILALLQNSKILRTDIDNAIRIKVGKNSYKILTYDIKSRKFKKYK